MAVYLVEVKSWPLPTLQLFQRIDRLFVGQENVCEFWGGFGSIHTKPNKHF